MNTLLVRLKAYEPRRNHVLRRFTYAGIKFHEERGWYRVEEPVAAYLKRVRQVQGDPYSPLAFDVCTDDEAKGLDAAEADDAKVRRAAADEIKLVPARVSTLTTADLSRVTPAALTTPPAGDEKKVRTKREQE